MSKNNPENRGKVTELRRWKGKKVKPVLFIQSGVGRFIAAAYEDGNLAMDASGKMPIKYANAEVVS